MTNDEIRDALVAASGVHAYIDAVGGETFILDGVFTLQQLVEIGEVARKALAQHALSGALTEAIEEFGAERLAKALVEPKVGDKIRVTGPSTLWYSTGDFAALLNFDGQHWWADFNDPRNATVDEDGVWCLCEDEFEVIQ